MSDDDGNHNGDYDDVAGSGVGRDDDSEEEDLDEQDRCYFEQDFDSCDGDYDRHVHAILNAVHRNDPSITELHTDSLPSQAIIRLPLGLALNQNTHVVSLQFELLNVYPESHENSNLLLSYIRDSPILHTVAINCRDSNVFDDTDEYVWFVDSALHAVADNTHSLQHVRLYDASEIVSAEPINRLLETTQALTTLQLSNCTFLSGRDADDDAALAQLPQMLSTNQTLESLSITDCVISNDFCTNLLHSLSQGHVDHLDGQASSASHIRNLTLNHGTLQGNHHNQHDLDVALHAYLTSPHCALRALRFDYTFNSESMRLFLDGLGRNTSLHSLGFVGCTMDDEAVQLFIAYMQTTESAQKELIFSTDWSTSYNFGTLTLGQVAVQCVIGSPSLQFLNIENEESLSTDLTHIFDGLATHASAIRLERLDVARVTSCANVSSLLQCLPQLIYLRELQVSDFFTPQLTTENDHAFIPAIAASALLGPAPGEWQCSSRDVVNALRQNGSLYRVSLGRRDQNSMPLLNATERRLVDSFGQRNRLVPALLARPTYENELPDADDVNTDGSDMDANAYVDDLFSNWRVFPPLFASVLPSPRTTQNSVLIGLLALDESI